MGIETEYGIMATLPGDVPPMTPDEVARYMFRPIVDKYSSSNVFLPNASRLYLDVGSHPEFATAECDSIFQLIAYEKAGDRIVSDLAMQAEQELDAQVYIFKNNVDSQGNSYGCHENYLVSRTTVLKTLGRQLIPFLVTRQLIAGAGMIYRPFLGSASSHFGTGWCVSQRADHVWEGVSSATTRSRPMINTRDEPHADSSLYRRLHVIVGDSNMAEPTIGLKIGSTELVLEMIEAGVDLPDFEFADDIASIREIARDITGSTIIELKNGSTITALEMQRAYLGAATTWFQDREPSEDHAKALDLWDRMLNALETQDYTQVDREIDWVIKRNLITRYQEKFGWELDHPKLAQIDLMFHDIKPGRGIFEVLQAKGLVKQWVDEQAISTAKNQAPQTTRAKLRGDFLTAALEKEASITVDWMRLKANSPEQHLVELGDPFASVDHRVEELIENL
ncbi:Pup--protein ligase [Corynebacterium hindlerae]|uniref:Pup--protein ligase n=1 Tax=Corynebacterium hindlerae TaxID=699041 RepID=UPI001AD655B4|nr:Pup--protein ligase [Corynebacterium hindlerae]QTH60822.1 Pup--protein ligase [Corynebacterium hindlerae]